jgi:hypothetical protein
MAIATGSNSRIGYITEVTAGTTPATPAFNVFPINDFSLQLTKDTFTDASIYADRQNHFFKHGNKKIGGDVTVTLLGVGAAPTGNTLFDPWFESLFGAAWTSNVLKIGNTPKSFTFEKTITDTAGTNNYFRFKGIQATTLALDVALNAPVKAKFGFIGMDADAIATSIITGATYVAQPSAPQPMVHINANNLFKEGGTATTLMTAFSLNIADGSDANHILGSAVASSITKSKATITGSATFYFSDATLYNKFVNETQSSLQVKLSDGTRAYDILLPAVVYSAATQVINNDNVVIVTMPFTAVYDSTTGTSIQITRS